jgi:hypothetical protein
MTRIATVAILAAIASAPLTATTADAFFIGTSSRATKTTEPTNTLGLRADQLRIGSKAWFEQMEREGRIGRRN